MLFDLDGVVTTRDTMAALVRARLLAQPWRLLLAAPAIAALTVADRWPSVRRHPALMLVRIALLGLSVEKARQLLSGTGARQGAAADWVHAEALTAMRRHQEAGDRVVVVTASSADLARTLLTAAGAPDVEVVGSGLTPAWRGPRLNPHAYLDAKPAALAREGIPIDSARLYTDSLADLPLMRRSQETILVNPRPSLLRAARRALKTPPRIVFWS